MAFRYLSWILFPLLGCYAVYSLLYLEHKGWYSWVLSMLYGFLLTFGEQPPRHARPSCMGQTQQHMFPGPHWVTQGASWGPVSLALSSSCSWSHAGETYPQTGMTPGGQGWQVRSLGGVPGLVGWGGLP